MAIYHLSIKMCSRKGKSAVAAAAYRAGEKITNEYDGVTHDYTRKGGIAHTEILLPGHAPTEYADRTVLWNAVEKCERYKTAQLAREIEIALPTELTREQNISLARRFVKENFAAIGMCADLCIHDKGDGNPHAHIMLTMRPLEQDGTWGPKSRTVDGVKVPSVDWNERERAEDWRKAWAAYCNTALHIHGHAGRVDHRSFERQGVEQIPTVHLGVATAAMERRGITTGRGDINREIEISNQKLRQLKARIAKLQNWLKEEIANTAPPTLADILQGVISRQEQNRQNSHYPVQNSSNMLAEMRDYLTANGIQDMAGLQDKASELYGRRSALGGELNRLNRRWKALDEHLKQAAVYREHKDLYAQYRAITRPKKQEKFYEDNRAGITLYEAAKRHLDGVMNGHTTLPVKAWRAERDKLYARYNALNRDYAVLKGEVREIEQMRRGLVYILREENRRAQPQQERPQRSRGMER